MKSTRLISIIVLSILMLVSFSSIAQRATVKHPKSKVIVVKKKHGFFKRKVVYHSWVAGIEFKHRWVYFPRYNFYWDGYRKVYLVNTGVVWVVSKTAPKEVIQADLSKEKKVELGEEYDTTDSIQDKNTEHKTKYQVD